MQNVIGTIVSTVFMGLCLALLPHQSSQAEAQLKEVCHDKVGKDGKPVMKDGKAVQECKKIKVHKKLEGTEIPPAKK